MQKASKMVGHISRVSSGFKTEKEVHVNVCPEVSEVHVNVCPEVSGF